MHEMGLAGSILGESVRIGELAKAERIAAVEVEISPLAGIDNEDLALCFSQAAEDTLAKGASLRITLLPLVAECSQCGQSIGGESGAVTCPNCGSRSLQVKPMPGWRITAVETLP